MSNVSPVTPDRGFQWLSRWPKLSFFSDTDWRSMISRSDLPEQIQEVVTRVVSESRLSRFEKAQVTKELLAHFEDGDERGKPFPKLIEDFGDPTTVAALIRISKIRNRSMMSKLIRGSMWASLGGLVGYIGLAAFFHMEAPHVSVDYVSQLNEAANSAADEDKAWNVYRDVWGKHQLLEGYSGSKFDEIYLKDGDARIRYAKPSDGAAWEAAINKLTDSEDLLESFRVGGTLPALGLAVQADANKYSPEDLAALFPNHPAGEPFDNPWGVGGISDKAHELVSGAMVGILLPHIQTFRNAARILVVDTRWAMEQGDTERATRNIEAVFGMSNQAAETPCLVCGLVGIAVRGIGYRIIDESMSQSKFEQFNEQQLARIQTALTKYPIENTIKYEGERLSMQDIIQRVYSDDGNGDGRMTPIGHEVIYGVEGLIANIDSPAESSFEKIFSSKPVQQFTAPVSFLTMPTRKQTIDKLNKVMDEIETRFKSPIYLDDMSDLEDQIKDIEDNHQLLGMLLPAFQQIRQAMFRAIANQGGAEMAIAAYRFHKKYEAFPQSSEELLGEFLDAVPTDQLNGDPLNYKLTEDGFIVYSVGCDLDDDDGQPVMVKVKEHDSTQPEPTENGALTQTRDNPLATVNGKRPQAAGEFNWLPNPEAHKDTDGDWVIWPRYAEALDDLKE